MKAEVSKIKENILKIERSANERWNSGDCNGYLEAYSEDITYFDPATAQLLVNRQSVVNHIRTLYKNPHIVRSEYRDPQVAVSEDGNLAVLSYNLRNFVADGAGGEKIQAHWNTTEVYRLTDGEWRIVHSHWSFAQHPGIMQNVPV
ncbi:MAG: nuclear transport factor 2 family protein [Pirellulales bacterium]